MGQRLIDHNETGVDKEAANDEGFLGAQMMDVGVEQVDTNPHLEVIILDDALFEYIGYDAALRHQDADSIKAIAQSILDARKEEARG